MVKYTRKDYVLIGGVVKKLSKPKRIKEFNRLNKLFKEDNPRFDSKLFKKFIGLNK